MKTNSFVLLATLYFVTPLACSAATIEERSFSPRGCEYIAIFPTVPVVEEHTNRSTGNRAIQAQTLGDTFPWILAQCTTGKDGSPPPGVIERLERVRGMLQAKEAKNIRSSSSQDARGKWAKASGKIVVSGQSLTMAVSSVAGASSMLLITAFMRDEMDVSLFEKFQMEVRRHSSATATKREVLIKE